MNPRPIELKAGLDHIDLCDLMKIADMSSSGGAAKHIIAEGQVKVDGQVELRKRCKIRVGQVVEYQGDKIILVSPK
ncbi:MAG: RNA-binding S4 domain-containing protein [Bacteriovoracaceae bacterium]|nr:RNA-binding S4 domain-containing protein [Bacteriovoracaceae bacterium]